MASAKRGVLVTGGSGALGREIVARFVAAGALVAFTYVRNRVGAGEIAEQTGAKAIEADLTEPSAATAAVGQALEYAGTLDVLVNAAGETQVLPFALIEEADWDLIMAANLKSMFLVTREVARHMIRRRSGTIVNVGSLAGHRLLDVPVHYATAKAGVSGFTISLAAELKRYNIRVNSVVPGLLDGGIGRNVPPKQVEEYVHYCASGRLGRMSEVAALVYFLASDAASYINAQNIVVDGGL